MHAQLSPILSNPMDCGPPGSSVHRILQARILEWVAISSSTGSSQLRDWNCFFCIAGGSFTTMPPGKHFFTYGSFFIRCQLIWILFSWCWIFSQSYRPLWLCSETLLNYFEKDWAFGVLFLKTVTWGLAQPCFWHFGGQQALDHLLGWEREGSTTCTLET